MHMQLLDRNESYLQGAERVHINYQGKGLMNQLTVYADQYMEKTFPQISSKKYCYRLKKETIEKLKRHPERCIIWEKVSSNPKD